MNSARAKIRFLVPNISDVAIELIIDAVASAIRARGGRPRQEGPTQPLIPAVATPPAESAPMQSEVGQKSEFVVCKTLAKPGETPNSDVSLSESGSSLSLFPEPSKSLSLGDRQYDERLPPGFAEWYAHYPRKDAKQDAVNAWKAAVKKRVLPPLEELMVRLVWQIEEWDMENPPRPKDKMPLPATWLNGKRWERERATPREMSRRQPDKRDVGAVEGVLEFAERKRREEEERERSRR